MRSPHEHREDQARPEASPPAAPSAAIEAMLYCPVCSTRLGEHRCKLVCPRCGYYMSCSDYY